MTKGPILQEIWEGLPEDRRQRIQQRAQELEAEYLTLQDLRQAVGLTQASVSELLGMPQSNVSRLEKSSDMLLSTLCSYVEAIGGKLSLTVELPNQSPIVLTGLGDLLDSSASQPNTPTQHPNHKRQLSNLTHQLWLKVATGWQG